MGLTGTSLKEKVASSKTSGVYEKFLSSSMSIVAGLNDSTAVQSVEKPLPLPPLPAIYGDPNYISRSGVGFTITMAVTPGTGGALWSSFDLYSQPGIARWMNGRASALISFPLSVSFVVEKTPTANELYFSGGVAVLASDPTFALDAVPAARRTKENVLMIDGAGAFTGSHLVMAQTQVHHGIGVKLNAKLNQVIGFPPRFLLAGHSSGVTSLTLVIQGVVELSGLGPLSPF